MKSIRVHKFGGPEVLKLEEMPDLRPAAGQIAVKVHAIGVNPVDTYIRAGVYGDRPFPYTPGSDAAGVVEAVGEGVRHVSPGDRVYTSGTLTGAYAEKALCETSQVFPLPDHLTFSQGAAVNIPYATAYRGLFQKARAVGGETVLVHGASGGVGLAAVQMARAAGLTVIGTAGTDQGRDTVAREGAHHVFNHRAADYLQKIMEATNGRGVNVILEMLSNVNLGKDLSLLAKEGRVVVIGSRGPVEINPRETMSRDTSILGMSLFNITPEQKISIHAALGAGLENKTLRPVVGRDFPMSEAPLAHEAVLAPGALGKIVLLP